MFGIMFTFVECRLKRRQAIGQETFNIDMIDNDHEMFTKFKVANTHFRT